MNNCLTTEQILKFAWRLDEDVQSGQHVARCEVCRQQVEKWATVSEQLRHELASDDHIAAGRSRLVESLVSDVASESEPSENNSASLLDKVCESVGKMSTAQSSPLQYLGVFAMRHKRSLSAACLFVLLAIVFRPLPGSGESVAQETAKAISNARSVRFQLTQSTILNFGGKPREMKMEGRGYWLSSGAQRMEFFRDGEVGQVSIMFRDRLGLDIDHRGKSFRTTGPRAGQMSPMMRIQQLGGFEGKADRELGEQIIDGVESSGFEIAMKKVDDAVDVGTMQVWVAEKTHLPVRLVYSMKFGPQDVTVVMEKFEWDVALDESLFNNTPPPGYADNTPIPPDAAEQTAKITEALTVYAKAFDGNYPRGKTVYGDVVISSLSDKLGLSGLTLAEQSTQKAFGDFARSRHGFAMLSVLLRDNAKAIWNGSTVTARDADKVLLSWQTADGFQVLFGDLKSKSVKTEAELNQLTK